MFEHAEGTLVAQTSTLKWGGYTVWWRRGRSEQQNSNDVISFFQVLYSVRPANLFGHRLMQILRETVNGFR